MDSIGFSIDLGEIVSAATGVTASSLVANEDNGLAIVFTDQTAVVKYYSVIDELAGEPAFLALDFVYAGGEPIAQVKEA